MALRRHAVRQGGKKFGTDEIAFILDAVRGNATEDLTREQREDIAVRLLPVLTKIYR